MRYHSRASEKPLSQLYFMSFLRKKITLQTFLCISFFSGFQKNPLTYNPSPFPFVWVTEERRNPFNSRVKTYTWRDRPILIWSGKGCATTQILLRDDNVDFSSRYFPPIFRMIQYLAACLESLTDHVSFISVRKDNRYELTSMQRKSYCYPSVIHISSIEMLH